MVNGVDVTMSLPERKRPVHKPPIDRQNAPVILFVTVGCMPRMPVFDNEDFHRAFVGACADADAWSVGQYMIMPDHIHMFCSPAVIPRVGIKRWATYLKRRITIQLGRLAGRSPSMGPDEMPGGRASSRASNPKNTLRWKWQPDCWDTQIRSARHYHERWEYVRLNPVRERLVEKCDDWPWQGVVNDLRW